MHRRRLYALDSMTVAIYTASKVLVSWEWQSSSVIVFHGLSLTTCDVGSTTTLTSTGSVPSGPHLSRQFQARDTDDVACCSLILIVLGANENNYCSGADYYIAEILIPRLKVRSCRLVEVGIHWWTRSARSWRPQMIPSTDQEHVVQIQ